ncbi:MAG: hypothetical protein U0353_17750 [Sandaracinus sp.]
MTLTPADEEKYLTVLAITHYVIAGLVFLMGCFPLLHFTLGLGLLLGDFPPSTTGAPPPEGLLDMMGGFFVVIAGTIIALAWAGAVAMVVLGRSLQTRRRHTFCLVVAFVEAMFAPVGTALGALTILLLVQPSVRARFEGEKVDPPTKAPTEG